MKIPYPIQQKTYQSFDGTSIGYQVIGRGLTPIVLCNGLGGTAMTWKPLYDFFGDRYRFISWDYRGLFKSGLPKDPSHMTMDDHVLDLEILLKKEKITKALFFGWSMGVQVNLEYYRKHPEAYSAIILMNGTYGYPFHTALNNPLARYILPQLNELAHRLVPTLQPAIQPLANIVIDWKGFIRLISRLGLVHENLDSEIFQVVAKEMMSTNLQVYHTIMRHLSQHDASDVLQQVQVPTLIIAGDSDRLTPVKVAKTMAREIPNAELFIVSNGTHYSILEFPNIINLRVEQFLGEYYREQKPATKKVAAYARLKR